jgi:hypothetical protein
MNVNTSKTEHEQHAWTSSATGCNATWMPSSVFIRDIRVIRVIRVHDLHEVLE